MRRPILLAAAAAMAFGVTPAFAQPDTRDHRDKTPDTRDHRAPKEQPGVRDHRKVRPRAQAQVTSYSPKHGEPGTKVTITGMGLRRVTKVMFGPKLVTPDSAGPRQLVFTVPDVKRPGPKKIILKHPGGDVEVGEFRTRPEERVPAHRGDQPTQPPPDVAPPHGGPPHAGGPPPRRGGRGRHDWHRERVTVASYRPHNGKPGTQVVIHGTNFTPDVKVMFSGQEVAKAKIKPNRIMFKIPKRQGDGMILLQAPKARKPLLVGPFDVTRKFDPGERRKMRNKWNQTAQERWKKRKAELAKDRAERERRMKEREAELAKTRAERRRKRAAEIRAKWQAAFLSDPQVQSEMSLHAERAARLDRMRRLAEVDERDKLVIRIDVLAQREDARHERRMATLKANFKVQ